MENKRCKATRNCSTENYVVAGVYFLFLLWMVFLSLAFCVCRYFVIWWNPTPKHTVGAGFWVALLQMIAKWDNRRTFSGGKINVIEYTWSWLRNKKTKLYIYSKETANHSIVMCKCKWRRNGRQSTRKRNNKKSHNASQYSVDVMDSTSKWMQVMTWSKMLVDNNKKLKEVHIIR